MVDSTSTNGRDKYVLTDDPEVETVVMADEDRAHHPDLKDLSRQVVFMPRQPTDITHGPRRKKRPRYTNRYITYVSHTRDYSFPPG